VDVTSVVGGEHVNVTGDLTSSSGNSGPASATLTVTALADLAILKHDSTDPIAAGATLTYTLVVSNNGPSEASGVVITDTLPDAFTFSDSTCGDLGTLTLLIWNVGTLPPGGSYACTISGVVDAGFSGLLTNVAAVTSAILDPQPDNNTIAETTQVYQLASIGDYVWYDADEDGIQNGDESGILGVTVNLRDGANTTQLDTTTTDASGLYSFTDLPPGDYVVEFVLPQDFVFTLQDQGTDDAVDSDADPSTGQTISTTLEPGENDLSWDAGLYGELASIGDYVWYDADLDGIQDGGEMGMPDVIVNLRDGANTTQLDSATTDASGFYSFTHLAPGDYLLEFVLPEGYVFTLQDQGTDDAMDSDADRLTGQTVPTTLDSGENDLTWDAGMYLLPLVDVEKSVLWSEVMVNQVITYTISVTNTGSEFLSPVMVTDTMDAGLTFIGASPAETSVDGQTIFWADVTAGAGLAPGESMHITLLALAAEEGVYDNVVHVTGVHPGGMVSNADQVLVTVTGGQDFVYYLPLVIRRD
ncbi:MAG: SdrD B-like domain-containing protein, partial [Anaerolineae bacterium]|jgi:uncharacterized repeat protein (TIGR01451 family)